MWLISSKTFTNEISQVETARLELNNALQNKTLTIIVGNSLTRFSYLLQAHQNSDDEKQLVGWERAIKRVLPSLTPIAEELPFDDPTYDLDPFVIAQSVCLRYPEARQKLLDAVNQELLAYVKPSPLHSLLVDLNPSAFVTTNYDLQLERAFQLQGYNWEAIVKSAPRRHTNHLPIYKINGSLKPDDGFEENYSFLNDDLASHPEKTVLISGTDYDDGLAELKGSEGHPAIEALGQTLLIIGKSMSSLDLPFMAGLRMAKKTNRKAYDISFPLSLDDRLNLRNLDITALHINMPKVAKNEHYYVGAAYALMNLFPNLADKYREEINEFADRQKLIRAPRFVGIGLTAYNTIGRLSYAGDSGLPTRLESGSSDISEREVYELPKQGRRNMKFEAEEYPGGSSLTALKTFTSLDINHKLESSMISILNEQDPFGRGILDFCEQSQINTDGISRNAEYTWHSIVIVHDGTSHKGLYPGQRIFMDRTFSNLAIDRPSLEQIEAQLHPEQENLRLVYFDKYLAQPYGRDEQRGVLVLHEQILQDLIDRRPDVDILYETGGGGSKGLVVERALGQYINILTASFPFFARNILPNNLKTQGQLQKFTNDDFPFNVEFEHETQAIEEMLNYCDQEGKWFHAPSEWIEAGRIVAARRSDIRWVITTLHHYGALAIDLNTTRAIYCAPANKYSHNEIQSTVGAGDVFRGAFSYALTETGEEFSRKRAEHILDLMRICTQFAVEIASEKCRYFKMSEAFDRITGIGQSKLLEIRRRD